MGELHLPGQSTTTLDPRHATREPQWLDSTSIIRKSTDESTNHRPSKAANIRGLSIRSLKESGIIVL